MWVEMQGGALVNLDKLESVHIDGCLVEGRGAHGYLFGHYGTERMAEQAFADFCAAIAAGEAFYSFKG